MIDKEVEYTNVSWYIKKMDRTIMFNDNFLKYMIEN